MTDILCESLLEMHFHHAIVDYFKRKYGARFLKLIKPSTNQEVWVGFDQGWVRTAMTQDEVIDELRDVIQNNASNPASFYLGYFLQFKKVEPMYRRSIYSPPGWDHPCLRSELSLEVNPNTGLSQHNTLITLSGVPNASVAYACPMIFDLDEVYDEPDLDRLRMVHVTSSTPNFRSNKRHFIAFRSEIDPYPVWLSNPILAKSSGFKEWADKSPGLSKLSAREVIHLIETTSNAFRGNDMQQQKHLYSQKAELYVPEYFTLLKFISK